MDPGRMALPLSLKNVNALQEPIIVLLLLQVSGARARSTRKWGICLNRVMDIVSAWWIRNVRTDAIRHMHRASAATRSEGRGFAWIWVC
jgi:hypothetical protein